MQEGRYTKPPPPGFGPLRASVGMYTIRGSLLSVPLPGYMPENLPRPCVSFPRSPLAPHRMALFLGFPWAGTSNAVGFDFRESAHSAIGSVCQTRCQFRPEKIWKIAR